MVAVMGKVAMRSALVTIRLDTRSPRIKVYSDERANWPDPIDFRVQADKPIAHRSYVFVDESGTTFRLGFESVSEFTDRVIMPTVELAQGRGILFITIADPLGNETRHQHNVAVLAPQPYDVALGMQKIYIGVTEHHRVTRIVMLGNVDFDAGPVTGAVPYLVRHGVRETLVADARTTPGYYVRTTAEVMH